MSAERPTASSLPPTPLLRLARLSWPGRNPLARGVDRTERTIVVLFVVLALVLLPVMLTLGSVTYAGLAQRGDRQAATWHETVATLTRDTPVTHGAAPGSAATAKAPARWRLPDGTTRAGLVDASAGLRAGTKVTVWLDPSGNPVGPPLSSADAAATGVLVAAGGWLLAAGLIALTCWGLHRGFDRRRYRAWDVEWARVGPGWHDRHCRDHP